MREVSVAGANGLRSASEASAKHTMSGGGVVEVCVSDRGVDEHPHFGP